MEPGKATFCLGLSSLFGLYGGFMETSGKTSSCRVRETAFSARACSTFVPFNSL